MKLQLILGIESTARGGIGQGYQLACIDLFMMEDDQGSDRNLISKLSIIIYKGYFVAMGYLFGLYLLGLYCREEVSQ